jgi:tyrosinase
MRTSFLSATLAISAGVSALPQITPLTPLAPALPLDLFKTEKFFSLLSLQDITDGLFKKNDTQPQEQSFRTLSTADDMTISATCSNPRVRQEWDSYSDSDRQAFVSAIRCLMGKPASGQFGNAKSRYEDLVALHQTLTPNVHGSSKFLIWHRYYLWTFEDVLRSECGFDRNLPWWDETKYSGRFDASSIFSDQWFGGINAGGNCITNGVSRLSV